MRKSRLISFNILVYNSLIDINCFYIMIRDVSRRSEQTKPTAFYYFLDELARNDYLL